MVIELVTEPPRRAASAAPAPPAAWASTGSLTVPVSLFQKLVGYVTGGIYSTAKPPNPPALSAFVHSKAWLCSAWAADGE